jgi:hypothetical protein
MLGRRLHDQQRPPEHMLVLRQQMGSAHQQLQQQLPAAMQRHWQQQLQQQGLSEGQDSNGQQSAFQAAASSNVDFWPGSMHPLAQQQQQPEWLPQYRLGSILLDAATQAGMALEALLKCPTDRQVAVLLNYLSLPQGKAAMQSLHRHAAPALVQHQQRQLSQEQPVQQQHHQKQRRLSQEQPVQQQQQQLEEPPGQAGQPQQPDGQQQQQQQQQQRVTAEPPGPSIQQQGSQPTLTKQQQSEQEAQDQPLQQEQQPAVVSIGVEPSQIALETEQGPAEQDAAALEQDDGADGQEGAAQVCLFL